MTAGRDQVKEGEKGEEGMVGKEGETAERRKEGVVQSSKYNILVLSLYL
jgi:hypothetical protein